MMHAKKDKYTFSISDISISCASIGRYLNAANLFQIGPRKLSVRAQ